MNRQKMLSTGPKKMTKVPSVGTPSAVATPGVKRSRNPGFAPGPANTRMYGKADPAPAAGAGFMPGMGLPNV